MVGWLKTSIIIVIRKELQLLSSNARMGESVEAILLLVGNHQVFALQIQLPSSSQLTLNHYSPHSIKDKILVITVIWDLISLMEG